MKKLVFLLSIPLIAISCSKDSVQDSFNNESFDASYQLGVSPWNGNNPHDSIGYHHNQLLKLLESSYNDLNQFSFEQFQDSILKVVLQYPGLGSISTFDFDLPAIINIISYNEKDSIVEIDNLLENTSYSIVAKEFIGDFIGGITTSNFQDYQDFKDYVISNEEYLINNADIFSSEEMFSLLIATSVARHSGYLWYFEEDVVNYSGIWGWVVVAADVVGAIDGGIRTNSWQGALTGGFVLSAAACLGFLF
jgi:hypothetical protein